MLGRFRAVARPTVTALRSSGGRQLRLQSGAVEKPPALVPGDRESVCVDEVDKFAKVSREWWSRSGAFKYLHLMNPPRIRFIGQILGDLGIDKQGLSSLCAVDVGCGGGLASEALGRLGLSVLGVDAAGESIGVAKTHLKEDVMVADRVEYRVATAEQLVREGRKFDVVVSLEVIEHVADPGGFVESLVRLAKPGAPIIISTINRTPVSYLLDIIVPEVLLRSVPSGTHDYAKFIAPEELERMLRRAGAEPIAVSGLVLNPVTSECRLVPRDCGLLRDAGVQANYILAARKQK